VNLYLARWLFVLLPALLINEEMGFLCSMIWAIACLMVILGSSRTIWGRR